MLWTKISLCSICKGHVSERTSKLVAWWRPNHDLEQNGNAHPNNLMKKRKTKPKPIFRPDKHWLWFASLIWQLCILLFLCDVLLCLANFENLDNGTLNTYKADSTIMQIFSNDRNNISSLPWVGAEQVTVHFVVRNWVLWDEAMSPKSSLGSNGSRTQICVLLGWNLGRLVFWGVVALTHRAHTTGRALLEIFVVTLEPKAAPLTPSHGIHADLGCPGSSQWLPPTVFRAQSSVLGKFEGVSSATRIASPQSPSLGAMGVSVILSFCAEPKFTWCLWMHHPS